MKTVQLKSGKELKISLPSFIEAKTLYQAILKELKNVDMDQEHDNQFNMIKELFCSFMASAEIENALWPCMKRCTYAGHKVTPDTFEAESAREDYLEVCVEVAMSGISPFMKNLSAVLSKGQDLIPQK